MIITALTLVAALTRLGANYLVAKKKWQGWPAKVPSIAIFSYLNYRYGLWGLHLLNAVDLWQTVQAAARWKKTEEADKFNQEVRKVATVLAQQWVNQALAEGALVLPTVQTQTPKKKEKKSAG